MKRCVSNPGEPEKGLNDRVASLFTFEFGPIARSIARIRVVMRRAALCATAFRSLLGCRRCRRLPSVQRLLLSLLYLSLFSGVVTNGSADDRRLGQGAVPQASVESRPIRLPIIDGANIPVLPAADLYWRPGAFPVHRSGLEA